MEWLCRAPTKAFPMYLLATLQKDKRKEPQENKTKEKQNDTV